MKWLFALLLLPSLAFGDCDWSTGITRNDDGYEYTPECHLAVGQMHADLALADQELLQLDKVIELKNKALSIADDRADKWATTATDLQMKFEKVEQMERTNTWLYFGLGFLAAVGATYAARH